MRVIYPKIRHARYLYIERNVEKVWGARYTLGARYISKNTVIEVSASCWLILYAQNSLTVGRIEPIRRLFSKTPMDIWVLHQEGFVQ